MLKGKKSIYILVPLNLFIWSYVGWKIYSAFNEEDISLIENVSSLPVKLRGGDSVTYVLSLSYADPFLKAEPKSSRSKSNNLNTAKPLVPAVKPTKQIEPPKTVDIKYLGLVQNKAKGNITAMVSINGRSYIVKAGQTIENVVFTSITPELITARIGKEKLSIKK
jgi:hypothetical protein